MIASKYFSIVIGLLAHSYSYRVHSQAVNPACSKDLQTTQANCQIAYRGIQYTKGAITGEETKIVVNAGNCKITIGVSNSGGAVIKKDIEDAVDGIFKKCPVSFPAQSINKNFRVIVITIRPDDAPFGSNSKLGTPTCGFKSRAMVTKVLIKPEDCSQALTLGIQNFGRKPIILSKSGTCTVLVKSINDLPITLVQPDLSALLNKITDTCKIKNGIQPNGILMNPGGNSGPNAKITIEIGNTINES